MNKIFSVIWSVSAQRWVVASELVRKKSKKGQVRRLKLSFFCFSALTVTVATLSLALTTNSFASTTLGTGAVATDTSVAISGGAGATANNISVAVGDGSVATGQYSIGLGTISSATGKYAFAGGWNAKASGESTVSLGSYANSSGLNSTALGAGTVASAAQSTAIGVWASATGAQSVALGSGTAPAAAASAAGTNSVALGTSTKVAATASSGVAIGHLSAVNEQLAIAIGDSATAGSTGGTGNNQIAIGYSADAYGASSLALGDSATAGGANGAVTRATAIGYQALVNASNSIALGSLSNASVANSVALGANSAATGTTLASAAYGVGGSATAGGEVNIGNSTNGRRITGLAPGSQGTDAVTVSQLNKVGQDAATALGGGASLNSTTGVWTAPSYSTNSIGIDGKNLGPLPSNNVGAALSNLNAGLTNTAEVAVKYDDATNKTQVTFNPTGTAVKLANVAPGTLSSTSTDAVNGSQLFTTNASINNIVNNGTGIKYFHSNSTLADSAATGQNSVAVGPAASSTAVNAVAIGNGAVAGTANSIALGNGATTASANAIAGGVFNGTTFTYAGATPTGVLSVGSVGSERQITNVAAGRVSASSTDGINGSQLFATNNAVDGLGTQVNNMVNNGTGIKYFHSNSTLADSSATGQDSVAVGPAASSTAANAVAIGNGAVAGTANSIALGNGATTALANATASGVVNGTTFTYAGATPTGVLSVGSVGSERQITNVAAGRVSASSTDGINGSQLFSTNNAVDGLGTQVNNLVNNGTGIKYFHSNSTLADSAATGQNSVAVGPAASSTAVNAVAIGNGAVAGTANSIALGNGATTASANAIAGGVFNGTTFTYAGATPTGVLSVGSVGSERQITNVAAGRVSASSTDGINGSQLFSTNNAVDGLGTQVNNLVNNGTGIKYFHSNSTLADSSATGQDSVAVGPAASSTAANAVAIGNGAVAGTANSIALGNGATTALANATASGVVNGTTFTYAGATPTGVLSVGSVGSERQITNVAAGRVSASSTDGINGSQLFSTNNAVDGLGTQVNNLVNNGTGIKYFHSNSTLADSSATGQDSVAVGPAASSTAANAVAIGNGAVAGTANSIALGNGATTALANATASGVVNGTTFTYAGATPTGVLSVGSVGSERQITNVAAGRVSASSTDGINGSQLFSTNNAVDGLGTQVNNLVNNGTGIKYFHSNSTLADSSATGQDSVAVGPAASSTAANAVAIGNGAVAGTANSIALGNGATTALANATASGVVNGTTFTYAGATPTGVLSVGSVGSERQITNVAAGRVSASSTDGINGSQLFSTNNAVDGLGTQVNNLVNNGTGIKYFHSNSTLADSSATGQDSVAVGPAASSTAANAVAIGNGAVAGTANSIALGNGATTALANATASGVVNGTTFTYAGATPTGVLSVGSVGSERQITNVAAGRVSASSTDGINGSQLFSTNNAVDGLGTQVNNLVNNGTGIKYFHSNSTLADSSATGQDSVAVGPAASSTAANAVAIGNGAVAGTANSIALGNGATTALANATASGVVNGTTFTYAGATPTGVLSVGSVGSERQITNVAAGRVSASSTDGINGSQLFSTNNAVDGLGTQVNNLVNNGTGIKYFHSNSTLADSTATGQDSVAIGPQSTATAVNSFAAGAGANAGANGGLALGAQSQVRVSGGIALGEGSIADRVLAPTTGSIPVGSGAIIYDTSDATLLGSVSLGKNGEYRQITNVADGTEEHDAVTLRQLTGAMGSLSSTGTRYFHVNSNNQADSLSSGAETIAVGPATVVNGDNGIGIGNQASVGQAAAGGIAIGRNTQVLMASGIAIGSEAEAVAEQSVALGAGATANQMMSVALGSGSVTSVGAETNYNAYHLDGPQRSVGEVGIGTALGNRKITGVAAGTQDNEAVNVAQLKSVGDRVEVNTARITNLDGRVGGLENILGSGGGIKYLHVNSTSADSAASGTDAMALGPKAQAAGNGSVAMGNEAKASADGSVALGSGSSDEGRGVENYKGKYSEANNSTSGTVSVGNAANGQLRTVSNVADGKEANDAVNLRQLDGAVAQSKQYTDSSIASINGNAVQQDGRITSTEKDISNIKNGTDGMFQVNSGSSAVKPKAAGVDSVAGGAGAVASGRNSAAVGTKSQAVGDNSVALGHGATASAKNSTALGNNAVADRENAVSVGSVGNERQITNVAAGSSATDAVNFEQLTKSVAGITNSANEYTDRRYSELKHDLNQQDDILSAGIAGAMAMASLPQPYSPGASMTAASVGNYRGQSSLAIGVSHISANGRWVTKLQGSADSQRQVGLAVGVGYQW
ncbi:YadA-like family protein [Pseudomonas sp. OST1909]|uniref:YadA-like family protein n=1 Tax=Pseudomonas sp. OST1909 TaxID=2777367 RepID=UPI001887B488|nr:YadA-like family protein [Pseudomonas sp. OST1909]QOY72982.1 YadA-like family protein [Pseudomonas sp. OST1909]